MNFNPQKSLKAKGRPIMRKGIICIPSIIISWLLLGFLATTSADAVEDFSGDWSGTWESLTYDRHGNLYIHLNQSGVSVNGTFKWTGTDCANINYPLTGKVKGNLLSFTVIHDCLGDYHELISTDSVLKSNRLSGTWNGYENGIWFGKGMYNVARSINFITATAGAGGAIIPSGKISVKAGTDITFKMSPNEGYKVLDVIVDEVSVGAKNSYTFSKVSANHTIKATFETAPASTGSIVPSVIVPLLLSND